MLVEKEAVEQPTKIEKMVWAITDLTQKQALAWMPELLNDREANTFQLGGALFIIRNEGYWKTETDPDNWTFNQFLEDTYGLKPRKAAYLITTYEGIVNSDVSWDELSDIPWTKLREIAPLLMPGHGNPEKVLAAAKINAKLIDLAKSCTHVQLTHELQLYKGTQAGSSGDKAKTVTKVLKLHQDQLETYETAVEKAKVELETEFDTVAIDAICMSYMAGGKLSSLKTIMEKAGWEDVLETFGNIWPEIEVNVTVP